MAGAEMQITYSMFQIYQYRTAPTIPDAVPGRSAGGSGQPGNTFQLKSLKHFDISANVFFVFSYCFFSQMALADRICEYSGLCAIFIYALTINSGYPGVFFFLRVISEDQSIIDFSPHGWVQDSWPPQLDQAGPGTPLE